MARRMRAIVAAAMIKISAVLLAAGCSRRMGALNKLELTVHGRPMIRHSVMTLLASDVCDLSVVVGYQARAIRALLRGLDINIVHNPDFAAGQMTSAHAGLLAVTRPVAGVMLCLSDQPLLTPADINFLIAAFAASRRDRILIPTFEGRRGNPIIIPHCRIGAILAGDEKPGCRRFIARHPELTFGCAMQNDHGVFDIDSAADYQRLKTRLSASPQSANDRFYQRIQ